MSRFSALLVLVAVLTVCAAIGYADTAAHFASEFPSSFPPGVPTDAPETNSTGGLMTPPFCQTSFLCQFCWQKQPTVCYQCMEGTFLQGNDCSQVPPYVPGSGSVGHQVLLVVYALIAVILAACFSS